MTLPVPELTTVDIALSSIRHLPAYNAVPDDFKRWKGNVFADAISHWFFTGAAGDGERFVVGYSVFTPKDGVDGHKALVAIKAALSSFEPKHEHKTAGCAYMLSEWFDVVTEVEAA